MESINEEIKNIIKKANSDNLNEVEEGLNYICKKMKSNDLKKICSNKDYGFDIYEIFTKKQNYTNPKIASLLPDLLNKISILKDENIFMCFNGCGGCLITVIFLIVGNVPSLQTKLYNFVINYLGDYNGAIFEKNSFMKMAEKIVDDLKESDDEICGRFNNSIWKDYLQATGDLFSSNEFVEKSQEDSTKVNTIIEDFIKKNGFNKQNAKDLLKIIISQ